MNPSPKEKAVELFNAMLFEIEHNCQPSLSRMVAKRCALIALNEIYDKEGFHNYYRAELIQVKAEINKL